MPTENWDSLERAIVKDIDPILKQFGYSTKGAESVEEGGVVIEYEPIEQSHPTILVDAMKRPKLEIVDKAEYETWLRVYIGPTFLKVILGAASETNPDLRAGWLYSNDAEMIVCIQEIVDGLRQILI